MKRRKQRRTADIDITPLIDVLFMLIIFFVLMASFIQGSIEVTLPVGGGAPVSGDAIVVTVQKNGAILWNGRPAEVGEIARLARDAGGREVVIAGDRDAPYGAVTEILRILRGEGVGTAGLLMGGEENN